MVIYCKLFAFKEAAATRGLSMTQVVVMGRQAATSWVAWSSCPMAQATAELLQHRQPETTNHRQPHEGRHFVALGLPSHMQR